MLKITRGREGGGGGEGGRQREGGGGGREGGNVVMEITYWSEGERGDGEDAHLANI